MTINLDTGSIQVPRLPSNNGELGENLVGSITEYNDTTPSEQVVYPSVERRLLVVEPNTLLVVTGYNLGSTGKVLFRKVLRSNGVPAHGTSCCCPSITIAHSIKLHSANIPCWFIDECNPVFVIKTPGSYEIDVIDGVDAVVTAMSFPMQEVNKFELCNCRTSDGPIIVDGK